MLQRQIAYKIQAGDILGGKAVFEGERLTSLECAGKNVLRINLIGIVIDKYSNPEKRFASITLDDGSGQVRVKGFSDQFDMLSNPEMGDTVNVIGMIRYFNNEIYVMPEIIRKVDPKWLNVRRLELGKTGNEQLNASQAPTQSSAPSPAPDYQKEASYSGETGKIITEKIEKVAAEMVSPKLQALSLIKKEGEIGIDKLAGLMGKKKEDINQLINDLLSEGEIYELRPGYLCSVN